ncbi:MAG: AAA family ATPase [Cyanobacteria bacterium]|nr:AAA family ATPase [Cyanobacteriota bacterium]
MEIKTINRYSTGRSALVQFQGKSRRADKGSATTSETSGSARPAHPKDCLDNPLLGWYEEAQELADDSPRSGNKVTAVEMSVVLLREAAQSYDRLQHLTGSDTAQFLKIDQWLVACVTEFFKVEPQQLKGLADYATVIAKTVVSPQEDFDPVIYTFAGTDENRPGQTRNLAEAKKYIHGFVSALFNSPVVFRPNNTAKGSNPVKLPVHEALTNLVVKYKQDSHKQRARMSRSAHDGLEPISTALALYRPGGAAPDKDLKTDSKFEALKQYGSDLVAMARGGLLPPAHMREAFTEAMLRLLVTKSKRSNILLTANSGEGKNFAIYNLVQRIAADNVPEALKGAEVYQLNLTKLLAGTSQRGQYEERFKQVCDEVQGYLASHPTKKMILVVDEFHTVPASGINDSAPSLMEMMKTNLLENPVMQGRLSVIGVSTHDDMRGAGVTKNKAFMQRFQPMALPKFSDPELRSILGFQAIRLQKEMPVVISPEVLDAVLKTAKQRMPQTVTRGMEDLLDLTVAVATGGNAVEVAKAQDALASLDMREQFLKAHFARKKAGKESQDPVLSPQDVRYRQELDGIPGSRTQLEARLDAAKLVVPQTDHAKRVIVTPGHVSAALAIRSGDPLASIGTSLEDKLRRAETELAKVLIGQPDSIRAVSRALRRIANKKVLGSETKQPIGSFMFVGPTGVGKTYTAQAIADVYCEGNLIQLDMTEYMEKASVNRIIGAPPGYIGYDDVETLCDKVNKQPFSVLLFDEFEKAHPEVRKLVLQILEEGQLTDSRGKVAKFNNTIVILSSNHQQLAIRELMLKHQKEVDAQNERLTAEGKKPVDPEVSQRALVGKIQRLMGNYDRDRDSAGFPMEQLGRMEMVPYHPLYSSQLPELLRVQLATYNQKESLLKDKQLTVSLSAVAQTRLVELAAANVEDVIGPGFGFKKEAMDSPKMLQTGARDLRDLFRNNVRDKVEECLIAHPDLYNSEVEVDYHADTDEWTARPKVKIAGLLPDYTASTDSRGLNQVA